MEDVGGLSRREEAHSRKWYESDCGWFGDWPSEVQGCEEYHMVGSDSLAGRWVRPFAEEVPGEWAYGTRSCWAKAGCISHVNPLRMI